MVLRRKSHLLINGVFNNVFEGELSRLGEQYIFSVEVLSERVDIVNFDRVRPPVFIEVGPIFQRFFSG